MVGVDTSPKRIETVESGVGDDEVLHSDMSKPAVHRRAAKVHKERILQEHVGRQPFRHGIAANAHRAILHERICHAQRGPALHKNAPEYTAPLARNVVVKRLQAVALEHNRIVVAGAQHVYAAAASNPKPRTFMKVNARPRCHI